jgi:hypothetical protein
MRSLVVTAAALVGLGACTDERPAAETSGTETTTISGTETASETASESVAETETEAASESEAESETEAETEAASEAEAEAPVDPALAPVEGEAPPASVARCEETSDANTCIVLALDEQEELRARERQRLIEAHQALGNEERMLDQMEAFLEDYPLDRRGNAYRIALRQAGRL